MIVDNPPWEERFWPKVEKTDGCWNWTASTYPAGYGQFFVSSGVPRRAHRLSYELAHGPIPDGLYVCHRCDNRRCVRPDHLFLGTQGDNLRDCVAKRRHARHVCPERCARGERVGGAKLTDSAVLEMRQRAAKGENTVALSREYGVTHGAAWHAITGRSWKHVGGLA